MSRSSLTSFKHPNYSCIVMIKETTRRNCASWCTVSVLLFRLRVLMGLGSASYLLRSFLFL